MYQVATNAAKAFDFGGKDCLVVSDGDVPYDNNCFAPGIPPKELHAVRQNATGYISLAHNILVFPFDDRIILIDAGNGEAAMPAGGKLISNLKAAGIAPENVTDVVLTHAHPDHLGGLVDLNSQPVFPMAKVYLSQAEYDFWQSDTPDFSRSKNRVDVLADVQQNIKQLLAALKDRLHLFNSSSLPFGSLQPVPAIGHTPGHFMFNISCGDSSFLHMADICHEDTLLFNHPEWGTIFDIDFELAAQTRFKVLSDLADAGKLAFGYHMPWPGFGRVARRENGFMWVPEPAV